VDTLSRLSHDADIQVAQNAVLALGEPCTPGSWVMVCMQPT